MHTKQERFLLVGIKTSNYSYDFDESMNELSELLKTAGGVAQAQMIQQLDQADPKSYLGKGKLEEAKDFIEAEDLDGIVFKDELTSTQMKHISSVLNDVKILDRTLLILDIFAGRALSKEGKIQVELAQLQYRLSRLTGLGSSLSRLGGGIGTRGPGEKKLETDRRHIERQIETLKKELKDIQKHRKILRKKRKDQFIVSLVGYTNAGKSSLMNVIAHTKLLAENKLFATLDPTAKIAKTTNNMEFYIVDTVGFIENLPRQLMEAFKATLEELYESDLILHVIDSYAKNRSDHIAIVNRLLVEMKLDHIPVLQVYNKLDLLTEEQTNINNDSVLVSAKTHAGISDLYERIEYYINQNRNIHDVLIPYTKINVLAGIRKSAMILLEEHTEQGVLIKVYLNEAQKNKITHDLQH